MLFSVVVPTFNRPRSLEACLSALARLDYSRQAYEVIIADDGGSSDLAEVVRPLERELNVRVIRQRNRGPASARNLGAGVALGRFLAFTDDDCQPASTWLTALEATLIQHPDRLVGGMVVNALQENPYAVASQIISDVAYAHYNRDTERPRFFATNNLAAAAHVFQKVGGFNESFERNAAEDRDFCDSWLHHGLRLASAPDALVYHWHSMGLRGFWRQHWGYGRGAFQYRQSRKSRSGGGVPFEGLNFHFSVIAAPFKDRSLWSAARLSSLTALSQVAVAAGYLRQAAATARKEQLGKATKRPGMA